LSYIVEKDGSVSSPILEESSGNGAFSRAALKAITKWTYEPALENGEPVQQCNQSVRFDFSLSDVDNAGASRKFSFQYKKTQALIADGNLKGALTNIEKMANKKRWNLYEDAWFSLLKANYHHAIDDSIKQLDHLNRVIHSSDYIPKDLYVNALSRTFILNVNQANYAAALRNFGALKKQDNATELVEQLQAYAEKVEDVIAGDNFLIKAGTIANDRPWSHALVRNEFTITDIKGELYKLEVRCNNRVMSYQVQDNVEWKIPSNWQGCTIYVNGADDASFNFVEIPMTKRS